MLELTCIFGTRSSWETGYWLLFKLAMRELCVTNFLAIFTYDRYQ